jgi:iduronate 2-sulfatase
MKLASKYFFLTAVLLMAGVFQIFHKAVFAQQAKPNVLFISIDDLRPTLGAYGDEIAVTPNIDKLAKSSVVFTRHYVQQPSCAPSRTSMLTGLRPDEIQVTNHDTHFRDIIPEVVTLPELFKMEGYQSIGIGKIFHFRHGFQDPGSWSSEIYGSNRGVKRNDYALPENQDGGKAVAVEKADVPDYAYPDGRYTDVAIDFLRRFELSEEPFFLAVGYQKPHLPFAAPSMYWDLYDRDDFYPVEHPQRPQNAPDIAFHRDNELRGYSDVPDSGPIPVDKVMELRHGYYASVSFIDAQIGKLIETLEILGLRDNTIIVLWSDHGFHLGEKDIWGKSTNYELDAHAPFMISVPGLTNEGAYSHAFVESIDVYPTIAELAGIKPAGDLSGRSLRPLLDEPDTEWKKAAFNQFPRPYAAAIGGRTPLTHMGYAVRVDNWRYISWYNVSTEVFEHSELYFMKDSNIESINVSGKAEYADIEAGLLILLKQYRDQNYSTLYN